MNGKTIGRFMLWREKNQLWFPSQFPLSKDGTIEWYKTQVYGKEDRILFGWVVMVGK
jgi:hypothetical protein